jgi:hypothetical protein
LNSQERYKPPGTAKILTELIKAAGKTLHSQRHKHVTYNNKKKMPGQLKNKLLHSSIKMTIKLSSNYQGISLHQLHERFCLLFFS